MSSIRKIMMFGGAENFTSPFAQTVRRKNSRKYVGLQITIDKEDKTHKIRLADK